MTNMNEAETKNKQHELTFRRKSFDQQSVLLREKLSVIVNKLIHDTKQHKVNPNNQDVLSLLIDIKQLESQLQREQNRIQVQYACMFFVTLYKTEQLTINN